MGKVFSLIVKYFTLPLILSIIYLPILQCKLSSSSFNNSVNPVLKDPTTNNLTMLYSTYFGGDDVEQGKGIAVTDDGCYYVTGRTESSDFPILNAYDSSYNDGGDIFITKFSPYNVPLWSTFFGGSDLENSNDIAVTGDGSCYIIGTTMSTNFPTKRAYQKTFGGGIEDIFVAKFSTSGSLLWSTYLGGSNGFENGFSIAVSEDDHSCYVTGETQSSDFPTKSAYDSTFNGGNFDAFVAKFSSYGRLLWSSYLGGDGNDKGYTVAVTRDGSCYIAGLTWSSNFPTLDAFDATHNGDRDAFVTKLSSKGTLIWSSYLGGAFWDEALGITVALDENYYVTGYTVSNDFPTKLAYNNTNGGWGDAFVSKFAANGSLLWSTFLGGNGADRAYDVVAAVDCSCYIVGETFSANFPTPYAFDDSYNGIFDVFITRFATNGSLLWSTYLGGSEGSDKGYATVSTEDGKCYVIGNTGSDDFPTHNAYDYTLGYASDAFIVAFIDPFPPIPYIVPSLPLNYSYTFYGILIFFGIAFIVVLIIYVRRK